MSSKDAKDAETTPLLSDSSPSKPSTPITSSLAPSPEPLPTGSSSAVSPPIQPQPSTAGQPVPRSNNGRDGVHPWGPPAGLEPRQQGDESLRIFQLAVGIGCQPVGVGEEDWLSLELGRRSATGIYLAVIKGRRWKLWMCRLVSIVIYTCHIVQILVGATLTAFGPVAGDHALSITVLGSVNTVIAGSLALFKGQGLPERLHKDEVEYRRLQVWIEETYALLQAGVLGRDRQEVDMLVETVFRKYNAVLASEENNKPDSYVRQEPESGEGGGARGSSNDYERNGNAVIRLPRAA